MNMSESEDEKYLPPELVTEVLVRLPVKSIFQFRCVSKYWLHRIPDSNLISLHLNHIINFKLTSFNHTSPILTVQYGSDSKYLNIHSLQNFEQSSIVMTTPPSYYPLVSNHGLVLMVDDVSNPRYLILVNPTLKTWLLLPPCPVPLTNCRVVYAIGFAPTANDFKVLVFRNPHYSTNTPPFSAVYTLNNGCWTTKDMDFDKNYKMSIWRTLFTKCKAHWWGTRHGYQKVITFDIDAEKFSYLGLPLEYVNRVGGIKIRTGMELFSLRGSVAIVCVSMLGFYIWVLDDEVGHGGDHPMWRQFYHGFQL